MEIERSLYRGNILPFRCLESSGMNCALSNRNIASTILNFSTCSTSESAIYQVIEDQSEKFINAFNNTVIWPCSCIGISFPMFSRQPDQSEDMYTWIKSFEQFQSFYNNEKDYFTLRDIVAIISQWYSSEFTRSEADNTLEFFRRRFNIYLSVLSSPIATIEEKEVALNSLPPNIPSLSQLINNPSLYELLFEQFVNINYAPNSYQELREGYAVKCTGVRRQRVVLILEKEDNEGYPYISLYLERTPAYILRQQERQE